MTDKNTKKAISANQSVALLFPNLKMAMTSKLLGHIGDHLKQRQINSYIVPNHIVQDNSADFRTLEKDENLMQRLVTEVTRILTDIEPEQRRNVLLIGISGGARFMVAYALAKKLGLVPESDKFSIPGLLAFNIYTNLRHSKPTPAQITELYQINHMDLRSNIERLPDTLIYDVYTNLDSIAADMAGVRETRFKQAGLNFKQHCITCCDISKDEYYEKHFGEYHLYTEISGHNLKSGYLKRDDGTYELAHRLHGADDSPVENIIDQFLIDVGISRVQ
jgi:hypothetical protein